MITEAIQISSVSKKFGGVIALDEFSCTIHTTELVGIIGLNGAGKTTLFDVITRLINLDQGTILCNGQNLESVDIKSMVRLGVARTFQELRLIGRLTVLENVLFCFQYHPREHFTRTILSGFGEDIYENEIKDKGIKLLEDVGLVGNHSDHASELSYGQQKLLSIACCIATNAGILLLDEPIAGVAPELKEQILSLIMRLNSTGKTIILIEHDVEAIWELCTRVIFMDQGRLIADGPPDDVRNNTRVLERYVS